MYDHTYMEEIAMNRPKRHHYVPEMLLRNFANENARLYFFHRDSEERCVRDIEPRNFCVECELYTVYDENGDADVSLEKELGRLEEEAKPVITEIIENARAGKAPGLTPSEKETWNRFFMCQCGRTPDITNEVLSRGKKKTKEEISELREELGRDLFYDLPNPPEYRLKILGDKGLLIAVIRSPKKSFVIGSHPIVRSHRGIPLTHPEVQFWLPIASDVAVTPYFTLGQEKCVEARDPAIREINEEVFRWSSAIAGRSDRLIASLAGVPDQENR